MLSFLFLPLFNSKKEPYFIFYDQSLFLCPKISFYLFLGFLLKTSRIWSLICSSILFIKSTYLKKVINIKVVDIHFTFLVTSNPFNLDIYKEYYLCDLVGFISKIYDKDSLLLHEQNLFFSFFYFSKHVPQVNQISLR